MIPVGTNVLSELTRRRPTPRELAWLEAKDPLIAAPATALLELRYGISRPPSGSRHSSLLRFLQMTRDHFRGRILLFDESATEAYGEIAAEAERSRGRLIVAARQIPAISLVHGTTIQTRKLIAFNASGASLVNPWD